MNREEKIALLEANGWERSWSDDNWVRSDAKNKEANTGIDTESALAYELRKANLHKLPPADPTLLELSRYKLVNSCETAEDLKAAILSFADDEGNIRGRSRNFVASKMAANVIFYLDGLIPFSGLTREYGIRQQAVYLRMLRGNL